MTIFFIALIVLFLLVIPYPIKLTFPKEKKNKKEKPKEKKQKTKKSKKKKFPYLDFAKKVIPNLPRAVKYLFRHTIIVKLKLDMIVSGLDAAETAIKFGNMNVLVYGLLTLAENIVTIKPKEIHITPDFYSEKNDYKLSFVIRFIPLAIIIAILPLGFTTLKALREIKKEKK